MECTQLAQILIEILKNHPTPQSLKNKHFFDQLTVFILNKKPATHAFICDSTMSIQVEFKTDKAKILEEYELNPWNKIMTHYYQVTHDHDKWILTLNCTDKNLFDKYGINASKTQQIGQQSGMFDQQQCVSLENLQQDYEPHAYEPLYYFPRNKFDIFLKNRHNLFLQESLQKIRIKDWVLKIQNISRSNFYCFVIEIYNFKFLNERVRADQLNVKKQKKISLKNIGSILYDKRFQIIAQRMRLQHIRQDIANTKHDIQQNQISMCYHLRNVQTSHKLPKLSQFVTLDIKGQILKFDKNRPASFIPYGQLEGICSFPQPINLNEPQKKQQLRELNAFSMKGLYEILNKQAFESKKYRKLPKQRNKTGPQKIGEEDWNLLMKQRLQNSFYRVRQSDGNSNSSEDKSELWSVSDVQQKQQQTKKGREENENYVSQYSRILRMPNSDSQESSEEENQYFRRYRQEMKKLYQK